MRNILLTLGHNSSAILLEDDRVVWGWETERLTGIKSDSTMPPILSLLHDVHVAYVTHWSPDGILNSNSHKHWQPELLNGRYVRTLTPEVSHHDTHMAAAVCYAGRRFPYGKDTVGLVIDGFGSLGEHLSVYQLNSYTDRHLLKRVRGYNTSLGLLYQYATAFMGMKMHEDEYKLLGYEVHVPDHLVDQLDAMASNESYDWLAMMTRSPYGSKYDPIYSLSALTNTKARTFDLLSKVCKQCEITDPTSFVGRSVLAYFVQALLEAVVLSVVSSLTSRSTDKLNLILSGGVFYNVKLNHKLLCHVAEHGGQMCVYPLAGDQGNAIGLYFMEHPSFEFPSNLLWGRRDLITVGQVDGLYVMPNERMAKEFILEELRINSCVNVVRGAMEFGPRALCNTSTLAMPTRYAVNKINAANNRNTVMPMAPVMTYDMYLQLFNLTNNVWRSERHMIVAMEYKDEPPEEMMGIAHWYNHPRQYATGRPQVADDNDFLMQGLLKEVGHPLINTSFNYHGKPIAFTMSSVIENHRLQQKRDPSIKTVVVHNGT